MRKSTLVMAGLLAAMLLLHAPGSAQTAPAALDVDTSKAKTGPIMVEMKELAGRRFLEYRSVYYVPVIDVARALGFMAGTQGKDCWVYIQGKWYTGKTYACEGTVMAELVELGSFLKQFRKVYLFPDLDAARPKVYALSEETLADYHRATHDTQGPPPAGPATAPAAAAQPATAPTAKAPAAAPARAPQKAQSGAPQAEPAPAIAVERCLAESLGSGTEGLYFLIDVRNRGKSEAVCVGLTLVVTVDYPGNTQDRREFPLQVARLQPGQRVQVKVPTGIRTTRPLSTCERTFTILTDVYAGPARCPASFGYGYPFPVVSYPGAVPAIDENKATVSCKVTLDAPEEGEK